MQLTPDDPIEIAKFWKSARNRTQSIVVSIKTYEGHIFLDCRLHGTDRQGRSVATPKGITISRARLPEFFQAIVKAEAKARELGLIGEGAGD